MRRQHTRTSRFAALLTLLHPPLGSSSPTVAPSRKSHGIVETNNANSKPDSLGPFPAPDPVGSSHSRRPSASKYKERAPPPLDLSRADEYRRLEPHAVATTSSSSMANDERGRPSMRSQSSSLDTGRGGALPTGLRILQKTPKTVDLSTPQVYTGRVSWSDYEEIAMASATCHRRQRGGVKIESQASDSAGAPRGVDPELPISQRCPEARLCASAVCLGLPDTPSTQLGPNSLYFCLSAPLRQPRALPYYPGPTMSSPYFVDTEALQLPIRRFSQKPLPTSTQYGNLPGNAPSMRLETPLSSRFLRAGPPPEQPRTNACDLCTMAMDSETEPWGAFHYSNAEGQVVFIVPDPAWSYDPLTAEFVSIVAPQQENHEFRNDVGFSASQEDPLIAADQMERGESQAGFSAPSSPQSASIVPPQYDITYRRTPFEGAGSPRDVPTFYTDSASTAWHGEPNATSPQEAHPDPAPWSETVLQSDSQSVMTSEMLPFPMSGTASIVQSPLDEAIEASELLLGLMDIDPFRMDLLEVHNLMVACNMTPGPRRPTRSLTRRLKRFCRWSYQLHTTLTNGRKHVWAAEDVDKVLNFFAKVESNLRDIVPNLVLEERAEGLDELREQECMF
ncbi:hypothetical protein CALCODRAFT_342676 [Calocera cornea HHB12733]|uniref:Uncharacterized protein n=1 Tax=Calocera cornea HHB12733 TaxID=1353952 RepID=A0A165EX95_9BASI|nr:hypothetical protein CALCODRAFT_342676 [Calocera cornea HHB12733]